MNAVSPPPHIQPKTGRECPYMAVGACNKCGWCEPAPDCPPAVSFDRNRVRIELCDVMSLDREANAMVAKQAAEVWLSRDDGKIVRTRTPSAVIVDDTRAGVLRQLADWVESREDESLAGLVREVRDKRGAL